MDQLHPGGPVGDGGERGRVGRRIPDAGRGDTDRAAGPVRAGGAADRRAADDAAGPGRRPGAPRGALVPARGALVGAAGAAARGRGDGPALRPRRHHPRVPGRCQDHGLTGAQGRRASAAVRHDGAGSPVGWQDCRPAWRGCPMVPGPGDTARQPALWNGFANMSGLAGHAVTIARGEGAWVFDTGGHAYLDALASLWYCNVGHGRGELADAAAEQMRRLAAYQVFEPFTNPPAEEPARE